MRRLSILALCAACAGGGRTDVTARAQAGDVAIVDATVVPMDRAGGLVHHTVLVRGDRIVAVAPAARVDTRAATVVDGRGRWVLPGLADMHVHLWGDDALPLFTLNGVTTVRDLFGSPDSLRRRDALARGTLAGPTLVTAGPILDGDPPTWPGSAVVTTADAARAEVRAQKAAGYDWIKVYTGLSSEAYEAAIAEAKAQGLPVAGHVPKAVGLARAIASGQRSIEHLDGYVPFFGDPPADPLIDATVAAGIWNCPTLVVTDRFGHLDDPAQLAGTRGLEHVPAFERALWEPANDFRLRSFTAATFADVRAKNQRRRALVGQLAQAGAHLVLGTDTGNPYVVPGFAVGDELVMLVESGLTPWQALRTATVEAAALQGTPGEFGVVAAGARADLLVLGADPLADVHAVFDPPTVIVRGRVFDRAALVAAATPPAAPADPFAALPALAPEGTEITRASYEVVMFGQVIGRERALVSRTAGGERVVLGQAVYTVPAPSTLTYRSTRDALEVSSSQNAPAHAVIARDGDRVSVRDVTPALALDDPDRRAVIAPQAVGEFLWYVPALTGMPVGRSMALDAVEVMTDGRLALHPGHFTFTRTADVDGRARYTVAGKHGDLDLTGELLVDDDGAPHQVTVSVTYGTFVTRRID